MKFIFWANSTELLLEQLVKQPEPEMPHRMLVPKVQQLLKRYKLALSKL